MAKAKLVKMIPELQAEWAAKYGNESVRNYLITVKGYTERQYRYIIKVAKLDTWLKKRTKIEDTIYEAHIETYADRIMKSTDHIFRTAKLATLKITNQMLKYDAEKNKPIELLSLVRSLAESQAVAHKALGITDETIKRIYAAKEESYQKLKKIDVRSEEEKISKAIERLDYDDIVDIIKADRARRKALKAAAELNTSDTPLESPCGD